MKRIAWNTSTCAWKCDKDCDMGKYLKNCECMQSLVDDLVVTCDEIEDKPESHQSIPVME